MKRRSPSGFALVSTLAILVIVTILLVAFATVMRTERAASQNFADRSRAEAIGMGMLNRILAEHAAPVGDRTTGEPVKPFEVDPTTGLPTQQAAEDYFADSGWSATTGPVVPIDFDRELLQPIYQMVPDDARVLDETGLVRTSRPASGGQDAYSREFWAYDGLTRGILGSDEAMPETVPQWVDYYQPDDPSTPEDESEYPVAQVAFAIWDEGGKFDVNMVGADTSVNGIAPHDLQIEETLTEDNGANLFAYLNNQDDGNGERDRSNFSLRRVVSEFHPPSGSGLANDQGDDRWVFSVRELIQRDLIDPAQFRMVTTNSRDFDVRPEWDADRTPKSLSGKQLGSEDFLRSYINNPALFGLFYGAGGAGPYLVTNNLNEEELGTRLDAGSANLWPRPDTDVNRADWMQVMRLLAILRRGLPPYDGNTPNGLGILPSLTSTGPSPAFLRPALWDPFDVWGIGQNLIQASDPAYDYNLVAFNPTGQGVGGYAYRDPNVRVGIRLSPYITEVAIKVKRETNGWRIYNYVKLWNPYPYKLKDRNGQDIKYRVGFHTGSAWPDSNLHGLWDMHSGSARAENVTAPEPGQFKAIQFERTISAAASNQEMITKMGTNPHFRLRPYLTIMDYSPGWKAGGTLETPYQGLAMVSYYASQGVDQNYDQLLVNLSGITNMSVDQVRWYSFQIDDPRMGSIKRDTVRFTPSSGSGRVPANQPTLDGTYPVDAETNVNHKWTWILYGKHALSGVPIFSRTGGKVTDGDTNTNFNGKTLLGVAGYNRNFGLNWPGIDPSDLNNIDKADAAKMLATFALPGRPLLNIGEIGTVFAFRPWVTLNFANKIIPDETILGASVDPPIADPGNNKALLRPAAILDYFTTIGTPESFDFDNPDQNLLRYMEPGAQFAQGARPNPETNPFKTDSLNARYQDKTWLFESIGGSITDQRLEGNLRPIRGRINLNTASTEVLTTLLKAPYRMPASIGLQHSSNLTVEAIQGSVGAPDNDSDYLVTIQEAHAQAMAAAITLPVTDSKAIRPLRMLSDLSQLYDNNPGLMADLYEKYPQSVISAMIGRLAQFGTVRQQSYTIDMVVRTLNRAPVDKRVVTGEARLQARVFFDSFSRQAFIESVEYK